MVFTTTPTTRDVPYLYVDASGNYRVFEPTLRTNASGPQLGDQLAGSRGLALNTDAELEAARLQLGGVTRDGAGTLIRAGHTAFRTRGRFRPGVRDDVCASG